MSELFIELFSEEIPANLQKNLRSKLLEEFQKFFEKNFIKFKNSFSYSTPNRLIVIFQGLDKEVKIKTEEVKGPNINVPKQALVGFLKSNKIEKKNIYKKKIDKGEFYFFKTKSKIIKTHDLLKKFIPSILNNYKWQKSMKWGDFDLLWARPLKSILCIFNKKLINFSFYHIKSSNYTFIDKDFEDVKKCFNDFKSYKSFFKKEGILVDQNDRKNFIKKKFNEILTKKSLKIEDNQKLLEEVINLTDNPNVLECKFDERFLSIPKEVLILTMQSHQKYFPLFNNKNELTNEFLVVSNKEDKNGFIKIGNEKVIEARLRDAEFFWNNDKSQNLVKKVSELNSMIFFKGLGTYFDKVQRMRKLGSLISDELLISKEKVELSVSLSKTDLISDIVREFPELQGVMGGYLSDAQGFEKEISEAIKEQYLPVGMDSSLPKKPYSIALSISDKIDTLIGFFGINEKPTSSKDPYALRRLALGIIRIIIENKKDFKVGDMISYVSNLYISQGYDFENKLFQKELVNFFKERFKYYLKEKAIRYDIIESIDHSFNINEISILFLKAKALNKVINKPIGINIMQSYKRAHNIISSEIKNVDYDFSNTTDPGIFKTEYEKDLYKKISEIKKYFSAIDKDENFEQTLLILSNAKKEISEFFDNVKVNEDNESIKKNRLELINILCKTFENFTNFQIIKNLNE